MGRFEGIVLDVGLGVGFPVGSCIMLVGITKLVALSEPIGRSELTMGLLDVGVGVAGMGMVAASVSEALLGATEVTKDSEAVAFPELGGRMVALLGAVERMDDPGISDAGTVTDPLVGDGAGVEDTAPLPIVPEGKISEVDGGVIPEVSLTTGGVMPEGGTLSVSLGIGELRPTPIDCERVPGLSERVSLGRGTETPRVADSVGVGTAPESVGTIAEDGSTIPDGRSDRRLVASGSGTELVAVGRISDTRLDTILGTTEPGRSGTTDVSKLEMSEARVDTRGGSTPDSVGAGDAVAEAGGRIPVISDTIDDKMGGSGNPTSEVGIVSEVVKPGLTGVGVGVTTGAVPRAVVIPTTIPPDDGRTTSGGSLVGATAPLVGMTMLLGTGPVVPTWGVGDVSGVPRTDESKPPRKP